MPASGSSIDIKPGRPRARLPLPGYRLAVCAIVALAAASSGCAIVTVVSTAAAVTVGVATTAVDVGVGAVKVTGKVVGKGIDAVTPSGPPQPPHSQP